MRRVVVRLLARSSAPMMRAAAVRRRRVLRIRPGDARGRPRGRPYKGHDRHPGLKAGKPQGELGKGQNHPQEEGQRVGVLVGEGLEVTGEMGPFQVGQGSQEGPGVQGQVAQGEDHRHPYGLPEAR